MSSWPAWISMRDAKGNLGRITWYHTGANLAAARASAQTVEPYLSTLSRCNNQSGGGLIHHDRSAIQYGTSNEAYQNVTDRMVLTFTDLFGGRHTISVPAPAYILFLADQETVDNTQGDIVAAYTAILANHVCSRAGIEFATFIGGRRVRSLMRRRIGGYILDPTLNGLA